ncbi:MAG: Bax inhibitor-1/YccA family protein [Candidatus Phytoplasma australasiaticum]|nr:Bax inhibitor-1/YccA family protein [Candidatus Phytoplasma australasiaticum]MDV3153461.1 Bax inhibitor-1/YccA family protein [Candidatus Phytoplasma australasiaticum]MDV3167307.1 Bax inhibitor-1/YccA family protein [Candidatus Phytoplasma australasiaticum]MDV3180664.1 Bax inhibitor-1/YccA family protein [Candidatus Phytoplasma australasiaticum]MDV3182936.1 Bax inhibitor-1/YccA family protein [Candidatus Phytoplasma australasiaticum]
MKKNFVLTNIINVSKSQKENNYFTNDYANKTGVIIKTLFLLLISLFSGIFSFRLIFNLSIFFNPLKIAFFCISCSTALCIGLLFYSCFAKYNSLRTVSILYSLFEGILLGSAFVVMDVNNFILLPVFMFALICVCFIFVLMNVLYSFNIIKVNSRLLTFLIIFTVFVFSTWTINIFMGNTVLSILAIFGTIVLASLNLVQNFQEVEYLTRLKLDKKYEWPLAFSFHIIFISLFTDFLRLLLEYTRIRDKRI